MIVFHAGRFHRLIIRIMSIRRKYSSEHLTASSNQDTWILLDWLHIARKYIPDTWLQFLTYSIFGAIATSILFLVYVTFEIFAPGYISSDLPTQERQTNLRVVMFIAFIPSNLFSYFTNRMFVFTPGRHSRAMELLIFTSISAISFTGGEIGKTYMVLLGHPNWLAAFMFALCSALVNFATRKFLIFVK